MLFKKIFCKNKTFQLNYEQTLKNNGVKKIKGNIRLLVIADTHGDLALSKELCKKLVDVDCDLCCVLGDIHDADYKTILKYIPKKKIVALLGNHDRYSLLGEYGLEDLNGRTIEYNEVKIGGIQGSFKYKEEDFPSFTHKESISFLKSMEACDILLSHDKPFIFDYKDPVHDGLKGITKYVYENKIPVVIHGHIHKNYNTRLKNGTDVIGVYGVKIIDIKNNNIQIET